MNIEPDELRILRGQPSKFQGYNSWLVLFASTFKKVIIKDGEVYIVQKLCKVWPYTSIIIIRCHRCQLIGHHTDKRSPIVIYCMNCGLEHASKDCTGPPSCINCFSKKNKTSFDSAQKALDIDCSLSKTAYLNEKKRLDELPHLPKTFFFKCLEHFFLEPS